MKLREKQAIFSDMVGQLFMKFKEDGMPICILCLYRDIETQKKYVAAGLSKTLNSKHLQGLAIDLAFLEDIQDDGEINWPADKWLPYGEFWESLGGRWGGRFGDNPDTPEIEGWDAGHFELSL